MAVICMLLGGTSILWWLVDAAVRVRDAWIVATLAFLNPDIRGAPRRVTHLMGARWTCWLLAKVNIEVSLICKPRSQYHTICNRSRS